MTPLSDQLNTYYATIDTNAPDLVFLGNRGVDKGNARKWIKAHDVEYHEALEALINSVDHVSFTRFMRALKVSVNDFNEQLSKLKDKDFVVLVEKNKSNQWVAELAYRLGVIPTRHLHLGDKQARVFVQYLDTLETIVKGQNPEDLKFPSNVVLTDDGSYSGQQIQEHVVSIFQAMTEITKRHPNHATIKMPHIFVVVPYMTDTAVQRIVNECKKYSKGGTLLHIAEHEKIPTVADKVGPHFAMQLNELFWSGEKDGASTRGTIINDHKIPNDVSFPGALVTGSVYPSPRQKQESSSQSSSDVPEVFLRGRAHSFTYGKKEALERKQEEEEALKQESPSIVKKRANSFSYGTTVPVDYSAEANQPSVSTSQEGIGRKRGMSLKMDPPVIPFTPVYKTN